MSEKTTQFRRTVSGTLNSGISSVFGSEGRRYFIIEHKDDSSLHSRGEQQKLIVDEVFIGRDPKCQVRIDEKFGTVSREHALIVKDGENWKLIHRSQTNQTYVNGQQIYGEYVLQNGDEIQLSSNGPRLGFIVPQGEQSLVKSIGLTARLNLFRQQALRPYKTALAIISTVALLAIGGLVAWNIIAGKNYEKKIAELWDNIDKVSKDTTIIQEKVIKYYTNPGGKGGGNIEPAPTPAPSAELFAYEDAIYAVRMTELTYRLGDDSKTISFGSKCPAATGFLTSDGYFVTARHVIEPWGFLDEYDFVNDPFAQAALVVALDGEVESTIVAESKNGDRKTFHYTDFEISTERDRTVEVPSNVNDRGLVNLQRALSSNDYAYLKTNMKSNLPINKRLSTSIPAGTKLEILGFPKRMGSDRNNVRPQYGYATTSNTGLYHGQIPVTGFNAESGNSGSPVICKEGNNYYVVGILSASLGDHGGIIIPITVIDNK